MTAKSAEPKELNPRLVKVTPCVSLSPLVEIRRDKAQGSAQAYTIEYFQDLGNGFGFEVKINGDSVAARPLSSGKQGMRNLEGKRPFNYFRYPSKAVVEDGKQKILSSFITSKFETVSKVEVAIEKRQGLWGMSIRRDDARYYGSETFMPFEPAPNASRRF
jgi:hypothetical protein